MVISRIKGVYFPREFNFFRSIPLSITVPNLNTKNFLNKNFLLEKIMKNISYTLLL